MKPILFWLLLSTVSSCALGQSKFTNNLFLRADMDYGFVLPEYQHFNYLVKSSVKGFEFSLAKKTMGKTIWEKAYKYPEYGITTAFTSLGNKNIYGYEFGLYPYFQTFLIRKTKFQMTNQFGFGVGYSTQKFNLQSDYQNISIGSHVNAHFNYKLGTRFVISDHLSINAGLSFTHFSNANMAEPNLGINLFKAYTGINYSLQPTKEFTAIEMPQHLRKNEFAFIYAFGGKHTRALQSDVFFTSSMSVEYKYHWKRKFHFGGGLDLFYDSSTKTEMSTPNSTIYKSTDDFRTGIHFSQEIVYDRFSFILQEGIYTGLTDQVTHHKIYNRAILRWKFNDHFLMHFSMKSHLHILDYPEIGFGYFLAR